MLRENLEKFGYKTFQTEFDSIIPFIHAVKFDEVYEDDSDPGLVPVERTDHISIALKAIQTMIAEQYLYPTAASVEFLHNSIWKGIAKKADQWHSDAVESPDVFFLLYFNDMNQSNTGAFLIKNTNNSHVERVIPSCGTLIAVENTLSNFMHRAEQTTVPRIAACFRYKVKWD